MTQRHRLFPALVPGQYPIFSETKPSEAIATLIFDGGTPAQDCELCGRVHFNDSGEFMDEGELEDLVEKQKHEPDKYIAHDGQIHHGNIDGLSVVYDCPCNGLTLYEEFIWAERKRISAYVNARAKENLVVAQQDFVTASHLAESVGSS